MNCTVCGRNNPDGSRFCNHCGAAIHPGADEGANVEAANPRTYTPRHLADKILTSRTALEGERKQVTVLFADVKSSMEIAEQLDPEELHKVMDRFFSILSEGVHRFEGTVNQYTGDGIMALFGAPIAHEDHAQRACYAALHIQDSLRGYADRLRLESGLNFAVRIGLNSGEVVVGKIGDDLRMDYTAQGQVVGLAARMEQIAEPGKAYLTENTARLVAGYLDLRDLGETQVKGLSRPLHVHELRGVGSARTRFDLSRARGLSRFVGRAAEMAALEEALESTLAGQGRAIGIVAEAGQGKSRLCYELAQKCRARGLRVYQAQSTSHEKSVPLLPALQLMRSYFGITAADDDTAVRDKVAGRVVLLDASLAQSLPILFEFLGVPDPAAASTAADAETRRKQLFELLQRLARARGEREAVVFLLEDLHWIDEASALFVRNVLEGVPDGRTLLVVNYRPELEADWLAVPHYREIQLGPLRPEEVSGLLGDLVGTDESLDGLADWIFERTGGNPFYVEEIVRALIDAGSLEGVPGAYELVQPLAGTAVPPTVQAILAARIDRLPDTHKGVLQAAAVVGKSFSETVLRRVLDDSNERTSAAEDIESALAALVEAGFIHEEALYPARVYGFNHALTLEVAYGSQLTDRRRRYHAAAAAALEAESPEKLDEQATAIARHWEEAGDNLPAGRWYRRAADWIESRDVAGVVPYWRKAAALVKEVPEDDETRRIELDCCIGLLNSAFRFGVQADEGLRLYERGLELAALCNDTQTAARIRSIGQRVRWSTGAVLAADPVEVGGVQDPATRLSIELDMVVGAVMSSNARQAFARATEAVKLIDEHPELLATMPGATLVGYRGLICVLAGRLNDGAAAIDRALRAARDAGMTEVMGWAFGWRAMLRMARGDLEAAIGDGRRSLELAEQLDSAFSVGSGTLGLVNAHLLREEWGEALELCKKALARLRESGAGLNFESSLFVYLAEAQRGIGDIPAARDSIERGLALAREQNNSMTISRALIARAGWVLHTQGAVARLEIEKDLDTAEQLARDTDTLLWLPLSYRVRAHLAAAYGDLTTAYGQMQRAIRMYFDMGAPASAERLSNELEEMGC